MKYFIVNSKLYGMGIAPGTVTIQGNGADENTRLMAPARLILEKKGFTKYKKILKFNTYHEALQVYNSLSTY